MEYLNPRRHARLLKAHNQWLAYYTAIPIHDRWDVHPFEFGPKSGLLREVFWRHVLGHKDLDFGKRPANTYSPNAYEYYSDVAGNI